jgi:hypothetical protein
VLIVYGLHATLALALAWPVAKLVADGTVGFPGGDIVLFEPGGFYLAEVLRLDRAPLTSVVEGSAFALLLVSYAGLLPLGATLYVIAYEAPLSLRALLAAGGRFFGPLSLLLGFSVMASALLAFLPLAASSLLDTKLRELGGDRGHDIAEACLRVSALLLVGALGVVHDLARAAVVTRDLSALPAAWVGVSTFRTHAWRALCGWGLRAGAGALLVLAAALATTFVGIGTAPRLFATLMLHQLVVLSLVRLRADWLAHAVRLCGVLPSSSP